MVVPETTREAWQARLRRTEQILAEAGRLLHAAGGETAPVSTSHAAELAETAANLAPPTAGTRRPRRRHAPQGQ